MRINRFIGRLTPATFAHSMLLRTGMVMMMSLFMMQGIYAQTLNGVTRVLSTGCTRTQISLTGTTFVNCDLYVDGELEIDVTTVFDNTRIYLSPCSKITVLTGNNLRMVNASRCQADPAYNRLWQEVTVQNNASLDLYSASIIRDALQGVNALNGGSFTLNAGNLQNNYVHLHVTGTATTRSVTGSFLTCATTLLAPYAGKYTSVAVFADNTTNFTFGQIGGAANTLSAFESGVKCEHAQINVYNSNFSNTGVAVPGRGVNLPTPSAGGIPNTLLVSGCTFTNMGQYGIYGETGTYPISVQNCTIQNPGNTGAIGIYLKNTGYGLSVSTTTFQNLASGIVTSGSLSSGISVTSSSQFLNLTTAGISTTGLVGPLTVGNTLFSQITGTGSGIVTSGAVSATQISNCTFTAIAQTGLSMSSAAGTLVLNSTNFNGMNRGIVVTNAISSISMANDGLINITTTGLTTTANNGTLLVDNSSFTNMPNGISLSAQGKNITLQNNCQFITIGTTAFYSLNSGTQAAVSIANCSTNVAPTGFRINGPAKSVTINNNRLLSATADGILLETIGNVTALVQSNTCASTATAIRMTNCTGTTQVLSNVIGAHTNGIAIITTGSTAKVTVNSNQITAGTAAATGIAVTGATNTLTVSQNNPVNDFLGISLTNTGAVTVDHNTLTNNTAGARAIRFSGITGAVLCQLNTASQHQVGIEQINCTAGVNLNANTLSTTQVGSNGVYTIGNTGNVLYDYNNISGFETGVRLENITAIDTPDLQIWVNTIGFTENGVYANNANSTYGNLSVHNNIMTGSSANTDYGIYINLFNGFRHSVQNNTLNTARTGVYVSPSSQNLMVATNTLQAIVEYGINVQLPSQASNTVAYDHSVIVNSITMSGTFPSRTGIWCNHIQNINFLLQNNTIAGAVTGIKAEGGTAWVYPLYHYITDNQVSGAALETGIYVLGLYDATVYRDTISTTSTSTSARGIYAYSAIDLRIQENEVDMNGTDQTGIAVDLCGGSNIISCNTLLDATYFIRIYQDCYQTNIFENEYWDGVTTIGGFGPYGIYLENGGRVGPQGSATSGFDNRYMSTPWPTGYRTVAFGGVSDPANSSPWYYYNPAYFVVDPYSWLTGTATAAAACTAPRPGKTVEEVSAEVEDSWNLAPNPATDVVRLSLPESARNQACVVQLWSADGRLMASFPVAAETPEAELTLPSLPAGVYGLAVRMASGEKGYSARLVIAP